jgi:hypothetical protein
MRSKLKELVKILEKEIKKAKSFSEKTHNSATELARMRSMSTAGDQYHAEGSAKIAKEKLATMEKLSEELKACLSKHRPEKIEPACFIKLTKEEIYVVNTPIFLSLAKLVSAQSPFGQELLGKKVGDTTSRGKITAIE